MELREGGQRAGFQAAGLSSGQQALLAHVRSRSRHRVGRYGVEVSALAQLVQSELCGAVGEADLFVIDEIGTMELLCSEFAEAVLRLLSGSVSVLATVAVKGGGLIAEVKARKDIRVVEVTEGNRDGLPGELETWVRPQRPGPPRSVQRQPGP
jgi:nucleoside-triphosphatase